MSSVVLKACSYTLLPILSLAVLASVPEPRRLITGKVNDANGGPVAGAVVHRLRDGIAAATDANGVFSLPSLLEPPESLAVCPPKPYAPRWIEFRPDSGSSPSTIVVSGSPDRRVIVVSTEGTPQTVNVTVSASDPQTANLLKLCAHHEITQSDARTIVLSGLPEGAFTLSIDAVGFVPTLIRLPSGPQRESSEVRLTPGRLLDVKVADDIGRPVANADVQLAWFVIAGEVTRSALTDSRGSASFRIPPDSVVEEMITSPTHAVFRICSLGRGLPTTAVAPRLAAFHGRLQESETSSPVLDAAVQMDARHLNRLDHILLAPNVTETRASAGIVNRSGCMPGVYDIVLRSPNHSRKTLKGVLLKPGEDLDLGLIVLERAETVTGLVLDESDQSVIADAAIYECGEHCSVGENALARSAADGTFELRDLPPRPTKLLVVKEGFVDQSFRIGARPERTSREIRVSLSRGGSIAGRVLDRTNGTPQLEATLSLEDSERVRTERVDANGNYIFRGVAQGRRSVVKRAPGLDGKQESERRSVQVVAGETTQVDFGMDRLDLVGTVSREAVSGPPVPVSRATVTVSYQEQSAGEIPEGPNLSTAVSGEDGMYTMNGLSPGHYVIQVEDHGTSFHQGFEIPATNGAYTLDVLLPGVAIRGVVVDDSTGTPISGVGISVRPITLQQPGDIHGVRTESQGLPSGEHLSAVRTLSATDGSFEIPFSAFPFSLRFEKFGYAPEIVEVETAPQERMRVELKADPGLRVKVIDDQGQPVLSGEVFFLCRRSNGRAFTSQSSFEGNNVVWIDTGRDPKSKNYLAISATGFALHSYEALGLQREDGPMKTVVLHEGGTLQLRLRHCETCQPEASSFADRFAKVTILGDAGIDLLPLVPVEHIEIIGLDTVRLHHMPAETLLVKYEGKIKRITIGAGGVTSLSFD